MLWVQAGRDVVACLNEAMQRQGLQMQVSALVCVNYLHLAVIVSLALETHYEC